MKSIMRTEAGQHGGLFNALPEAFKLPLMGVYVHYKRY